MISTHATPAFTALGLIKASGPNVASLLQGQLTCDVAEVSEQQSRLGAHCNYQGRVLASLRLFVDQSDYYLLLPKAMVAFLLQDLAKYTHFYKASLQEVTAEWTMNPFIGSMAEAEWAHYCPHTPLSLDAVACQKQFIALSIPGSVPRFLLLSRLLSKPDPSASQLPFVSEADWCRMDIQSGIASIYPETRGLLTPHQLNYHQVRGISFKKGCYTGQEVIARMHYRAKLKSQLCRITFKNTTLPQAGSSLHDANGHPQGTLLMSAALRETDAIQTENWEALACLNTAALAEALYFEKALITVENL